MLGFGFGAVVGSEVFDFTVCLGIASLFSYAIHSKAINFSMDIMIKDIYVYLMTLLYLIVIMWDYQVTLAEAVVLVVMWPLYMLLKIFTVESPKGQDHKDHSKDIIRKPTSKKIRYQLSFILSRKVLEIHFFSDMQVTLRKINSMFSKPSSPHRNPILKI